MLCETEKVSGHSRVLKVDCSRQEVRGGRGDRHVVGVGRIAMAAERVMVGGEGSRTAWKPLLYQPCWFMRSSILKEGQFPERLKEKLCRSVNVFLTSSFCAAFCGRIISYQRR